MRSLTLGRVRGIDVKVHPTFALVALWILYNWGVVEGGGASSILYGTVLFAFVFSFVLLHEFGHSLMAQHYGINVHDITLVPFGGIARLEQLPHRPRSEALIAIAGPAVNVAIAVAMLPLLLVLGVVRGYDSVGDYFANLDTIAPSGLLIYLFLTNIMIVLFNLLPAFPMDGGRLVRAGLSYVIGRERATRIAVGLGVVAALCIAAFGLWWQDFVLPLIAVFVIVAAYGESRIVRLEESMRRLRVGQFAVWDRGGVAAELPLTIALGGGLRDVAVTDGGHVVGMIWRSQLLQILNGGAGNRTVGDVMDRDVVTVDVDDTVYDVQQQMQQTHRWAMPVTEDGQYRGIFTADRFIHVYRYLNAQSPERRRLVEFAGALSGLFRVPGR
ncbi:MAG TPA: site-2 protease family protein [Thermomicrobiales bacterium]|jgi:Zn-dependent protease